MEPKKTVLQVADVLIIGGGGAGLRAAITARETGAKVLLVSRSRAGYGNNTAVASGGIAAAGGWREPKDNPDVHAQDTLRGGHLINDPHLVETMARGGVQQVGDLEKFGVNFMKMEGAYRIAQAPGHTYPRNIACAERIGAGLSLPMRRYALSQGVQLLEGAMITLLLSGKEGIGGAVGIDKEGQPYLLRAKATVLATGGLGQLYQRNNNAAEAMGDGYALAYEAGARLQDMEFVQFHPMCLARPGTTALIPYEYIVFTGGAAIRNTLGQDIMELYGLRNPQAMTRDRLAQAMMNEIIAGRSHDGFLSLDLTSIPEAKRERYISALPKGASYQQGSLKVSPAAHYTVGGVCINERAETSIKGLYASGEVTGGVQGADRLAGNSLTEIFVFGAIAGGEAARRAQGQILQELDQVEIDRELARLEGWRNHSGTEKVMDLLASLKKTMWEKAGIVRDEASLRQALDELGKIREALDRAAVNTPREWFQALRLDKMLTVGEMLVRAAQMRQESRGTHYRSDYPEKSDSGWRCNIIVQKGGDGMSLSQQLLGAVP